MQTKLGTIAAFTAFLIWGGIPIYWKQIQVVEPFEILAHRMIWSCFITLALVIYLKRGKQLLSILKDPSQLRIFVLSSLLIAINWTSYIWAVNSGYVVEASLGYFINPLLNICFGYLFFKELMRKGQIGAVGIATCGVLYLTVYYGGFPWIALTIAGSFAVYGVIHKKTSVTALDALCVETIILFIPSLLYIIWREYTGAGAFFSEGTTVSVLLVGSGFITTIPLLCFGFAARNLRLSTVGFIQYTTPTLVLLVGLFVYREEFPVERMVGFALVWAAIALYVFESYYHSSRQRKKITS